ncbi:putative vacuolar amino acid transporter YPQ3 [Candida viswanathii]|uniref:Putative vacuolar amino acid transporter YPQ3 n=1 Tax=Candida viswanathii TaxID=5486 RepID=A0A367XWS1_9ASCO|nr:putative vacuolar amino acid transporter YPQ3 [Candida viswanathii]
MMGPPAPIILDAQAISGITGSISIACWIIVFAPQIYENFRRKSLEGLSLTFIILWLAGDVFNVLGAVLQGVLPTMIILAVYYTLADIVLLWQCLVYGNGKNPDLIHLSPANPLNDDVLEVVLSNDERQQRRQQEQEVTNTFINNNETTEDLESNTNISIPSTASKSSQLQSFLLNALMVFLVIASGVIGWYISYLKDSKNSHPGKHGPKHPEDLVFDPLAQTFGWLCAFLYLGSRIPQIVLNYERKSCEGISFMFFLFACLGNLTYVISILSIDMSWNYLWVNSSWLAGSLGTLGLDFTIFIQFFLYNGDKGDDSVSVSDYSESETELESLLTSSHNSERISYGTN